MSSLEGTTINLASAITDASSVDTIAGFSYAWSVTKNGNPFASGAAANFGFTPDDNGTYVVSMIATDKDGGVGTAATQTITVANVAPSSAINGAPASSPEGAPINVTAMVIDASSVDSTAGFSYVWSATKNGLAYASGSAAGFGFTPEDNGTYVVSLTATDKDGGVSAVASATINVTNVAPTAAIIGAPSSGAEGTVINLTSAVSDPSSADTAAGFTYFWSVTKNGAAFASGSVANFAFTPNDNGTYVVSLTVTDKNGGATSISSPSITVSNVAPTVSINRPPSSGPEGTAINLTSVVSDASALDTAAGFSYLWSVTKNGTAFGSGTATTFNFTPNDNGTYVVSLTATDKDGGVGSAGSATILVANVTPTPAIIAAPASSAEGAAINLTSTVSDPSSVDAAAGFTYSWSVTKNGAPFGSGTASTFSFTPNDNGAYVVTLAATDKDGATGSASKTIAVTNVVPTAAINGAPASSPEGTAISLTSSVSDPGSADVAAGFAYSWSVTKNGVAYGTGAAATFSFTPNDNGTYVVSLTATDKDGGVGSASKSITVNNVAPTSTINGAPASSPEGTVINLTSTVTDAGSADASAGFSYAWNVTKNGAAFASGTTSALSFTPNDNGTYVVSLSATDKDGGVGNASSATVTVTNVAPTATFGPTSAVRGQNQTFTLSANDPSSADQAAGFTYTLNWGDGSAVQVINPTAGNGAGLSVSHLYTLTGAYSVSVSVADKDGGTRSTSSTLTVSAAALQPDFADPTKTKLVVGGTTGNDSITLAPTDTLGTVSVTINGVVVGTFRPTGHIVVYGQAGDDTIKLPSSTIGGSTVQVSTPADLYGDDGNDTLDTTGSSANNVLLGGLGSDTLTGGNGRNLLIGGAGGDTLRGGSGDDLLVGGSTDYDVNLAALSAIMAEWGRTDVDYWTRINHLTGAATGALNGSYFLTPTTVHTDAAVDDLTGNAGQDWFFYKATGNNKDKLRDKATGETATTL